jgi:tetratricopeptide (TPR) repeat protein
MPGPPNQRSIAELFGLCTGMEPSQREAWLEQIEVSPEIRAELRRLLQNYDSETGSFLQPIGAVRGLHDELPPLFLPGQKVSGRFEIKEFIRRGGMGEVYAGLNEEGEPIAVKAIRPLFGYSDSAIRRFRKEFAIQASINHPNVCRVFELGRHEDEAGAVDFFTMEFLRGTSLAERVGHSPPLSVNEAMEIARGILSGLKAAHDRGIVHRDLKPSNVMLLATQLGGLRAVLVDFGLARMADGAATETRLTRTGQTPGTLIYMAPEQVTGGVIDGRADAWAFGLIAFEMLTGDRLWEGEAGTGEAAVRRMVPKRLRAANLPPVWRNAIEACLEWDAADRPRTAGDVLLLLDGKARRSPWRVRAKVRRRTALAALAGAAAFGGVAAWTEYRKSAFARGVRVLVTSTTANDTDLALAISLQLRRLLAQSGYVSVWPAETLGDVWARMGRTGAPLPGEKDWREIALRENAKLVIFPRVSGSELVLRAEQIQGGPEKAVRSWSQRFSPAAGDDWLPALESASRWVRDTAGESAAEIAGTSGLEAVTTTSWLALRAFSQGERLADRREWEQALDAYGRALRLDPDFTTAWIRTGDVQLSLGRERIGFIAWERAVESAKKRPLTKREELYFRGMLASDGADYVQAEQMFREFAREFSDDWRGPFFHALPLTMLGRGEEGVEELKKGLQFPERVWRAHMHIAFTLAALGSFPEAARHAAELRRLKAPAAAGLAEAVIAYLTGGTEQALAGLMESRQDANLMPPHLYRVYRCSILADGGQTEKAIEEAIEGFKKDTLEGHREQRVWNLISAAWLMEDTGQHAESRRILNSLEVEEMGPKDLARAGTLLARTLQTAQTKRFTDALGDEPKFPIFDIARLTLRGERALAEGDKQGGLRLMREAASIDSRRYGKEYLAYGLKTAGLQDEARAVYEDCGPYRSFQLRFVSPEPAGSWRRIETAMKRS